MQGGAVDQGQGFQVWREITGGEFSFADYMFSNSMFICY